MAQFGKSDWSSVDKAILKEVKEILGLPSSASNHYVWGSRDHGCCGVPSAAVDSDLYLIDSAFKLLNSQDEDVATLALAQLKRTVRHRLQRDPTDGDLASFLSGCMDLDFKSTSNARQNTWTLARKASNRMGVTWSFSDGVPTIQKDDVWMCGRLHEAQLLLNNKSQGKAMDCVRLSKASSHFLTKGKFTRFADW
ncbi:reverse transcriptase domain-containing protein, partial [Nephila pilipes]